MAKALKTLKEPSIAKVIKRAKAVSKVVSKKSSTTSKVGKSTKVISQSTKPALNHLIGQAIAKHRKQAGLSQEQLAEALGIGYEAVSRMERGVVIPTVDRLIKIAEVVDCPVTVLLTQSSLRPTDEVLHLHQLLCSLSHENKQWLMQQVEAWVSQLTKSTS